MKLPVVLAALLALALPATAAAQPAPPTAPRLTVVISVDQLSTELWNQYRPTFRGGLARLSREALAFDGYQAHAATETCPGHSTILTGAHPARTGIVANNWIDQRVARPKKEVYCAEDVARTPASGYTVSLANLRVPTLGDRLKAARPGSRVVSVAGKDRAAAMLGGRSADQVWWWSGGDFTSNLTARPAPAVARANAAIAQRLAQPRQALIPPPHCESRARSITLPGGRVLNTNRFARAAGDNAAFRLSPEMDAATLALGAALADELQLGRRQGQTDLLALGLSATDYIGHAYGSGGLEMCLQLASLDRDLGDFLRHLDRTVGDYMVVLTADHGVLDVPERGTRPGSRRLDAALTVKALDDAIRPGLGLTAPALLGEGIGGDLYVSAALPSATRERVMAEAERRLRAHPDVHSVHRGVQIARLPVPTGPASRWTVPQRIRASYDPARSGDLYVVLKEGIQPIATPGPTYAATHGSVWDYDRRVPLLFWRGPMARGPGGEAMTVDIAPTLARVLGVPVPAGEMDGRPLDLPRNNDILERPRTQ